MNRLAQDSTKPYSFQIGAAAEEQSGYRSGFGIPVTGARVEIMISDSHPERDSRISYWVGIDLPDQAVIRVGYLVDLNINSGQPSWFWAYSKFGKAVSELIKTGSIIGKDGDWTQFSIARSNGTWTSYVGNSEVGSIDGVADSGGPYAVAEVAHASSMSIILRPVEFRNLAYRDANLVWRPASAAVAICCDSAGSPRAQGNLKVGVVGVPGENNHWIVGSNLAFVSAGQYLWPWYYVKVESDYGNTSGSGWYVKGSYVSPQATTQVYQDSRTRTILVTWLLNQYLVGASRFIVESNSTLRAYYKTQFFLNVRDQFQISIAAWYDKASAQQFSTIDSPQPTLFSQCQWVFDGWYENGKQLWKSTSGSIIMDGPHEVRGRWRVSCHTCFLPDLCAMLVDFWYSSMGILAVILFAIAVLLALLTVNKSSRSSGRRAHLLRRNRR